MQKKLSAKERSRLRYAEKVQLSKSRELLVIDERKIRAPAIREAKMIFRKIEESQARIDQFVAEDQSQFQNWFDLTTAPLQQQINERHRELTRLTELYNHWIYLVNESGFDEVDAIHVLDKEEQDYKDGDSQTRSRIDKARAERNQAVQEAMRQQEREHQRFDSDLSDDDFMGESEDEHDHDQSDADEITPDELADLEKFLKMDPEDFKALMKFENVALPVLARFIPMLVVLRRPADIRRIMGYLTPNIRKKFDRITRLNTGGTIADILPTLEEMAAEELASKQKIDEDQQHPKARVSSPPPPDKDHRLVHLYRRIVKLIHPDQVDQQLLTKQKSWLARLWSQTLQAKDQGDSKQLEKILHKVLIATERLAELSLGEIKAVTQSLKAEHELFKKEIRDLRKHPAWEFSKRNSFADLKQKCEAPIKETLALINEDILERSERLDFFRRLGKSRSPKPAPRSARKKTKSRRSHPSQMELGDW